MSTRLVPVNDWVIAKRSDPKESVSGLIIPERYRRESPIAKIVAVSESQSHEFAPEQIVVLNPNAGTEVQVNGEDLTFLQPFEIVCQLKEPADGATA